MIASSSELTTVSTPAARIKGPVAPKYSICEVFWRIADTSAAA